MKTKNQILKDLIENIENHTELIKNVGTRYYRYDRSDFIKFLDDENELLVISLPTNGGDITVSFNASGIFAL